MHRLAVLALAAGLTTLAATAATQAATTLAHEDGRILALAHDGGRIAWLTDQCTKVRFQSIPTGRRATVRAQRPSLFHRCFASREAMAMAGKRVIFTSFLGGGIQSELELRTAGVAFGRMRTLRLLFNSPGDEFGYFTGLAGDANTLVYSWVKVVETDDICLEQPMPCIWEATEGKVHLVYGHRQRPLPLPRTAVLAVSLGRVAVAPVSTAEQEDDPFPHAVENGPVEIRNARSGAPIASFSPTGTVLELAFSGRRVASLAELASGNRRVEVHSATTGTRQRSLPVSRRAELFDLAGKHLVYRVGKAIRLFDLDTGKLRTVARIKGHVAGLSIEDQRIVWAENRADGGILRSIVLP
jgi:hypothetical protein